MKVVGLALLFATASALCPNDCSGHGDCSHSSHCNCFHNWVGADCGQRTCTFGRAFVDSPWGDLDGDGALEPNRAFDPRTNFKVQGINYVTGNVGEMGFTEYGYARATRTTAWDEAHFYRECSNKGLCDRETGLCECFPGYEGSGCRRTACPQNCNGNGVCRTILESGRPDASGYSAWDGEKTQLCVCDAGWSGPACSLRSCPRGADPVAYNYKITNSIQGIYFRTFAPDKLHVATEETMSQFLKDKPSKVYFTVTFTDEYNDEWTTSANTIDYTTFCEAATGTAKGGICLSTPTVNYKNSGATQAEKNQPTRDTLERLSEAVNNSLLALPTRTIAESYVWSGANSYDVSCTGKTTSTGDNDLRADVKACVAQSNIKLVPRAFQAYPWAKDASDNKDRDSISTYVDSLNFRLDIQVTQQVDQITHSTSAAREVNFDGTDTEVFGLGLFVKLPGPGVNQPLQVRYWYTPTAKLGDKDVSYSHVEGTSQTGSFTPDNELFLRQDLVVIQDLVPKRVWNADDGDSAFEFSKTKVGELPYCSNRGICDFESGICNCFSGYTGLRCDQANAVTYSY